MNKLPFYIITSDATSYILPATCHLYNKYWNIAGGQQFNILGNNPPDEKLPENFRFIQIKRENNIQKWTKYLYNYILNSETEKFFILTLDDYWPNTYLNQKILNELLTYAEGHKKVGRIALGVLDIEAHNIVKEYDGYSIVQFKSDTVYRLSCQTSVWNREYFLKYFQHDWTPWQLELTGSKMAKNDGWEIIGTDGDCTFKWMEESALSGRWPGMINILGLRQEDVKYLIENKLVNSNKLQYGIWYDCRIPFLSYFQSISKKLTKIPKFSQIGYNFSWGLIKPYIRSKTFKRLYLRYNKIYNSK